LRKCRAHLDVLESVRFSLSLVYQAIRKDPQANSNNAAAGNAPPVTYFGDIPSQIEVFTNIQTEVENFFPEVSHILSLFFSKGSSFYFFMSCLVFSKKYFPKMCLTYWYNKKIPKHQHFHGVILIKKTFSFCLRIVKWQTQNLS
jgi:hypothetical protein